MLGNEPLGGGLRSLGVVVVLVVVLVVRGFVVT